MQASGHSRYAIAKATGLQESTLSRFANGKTRLNLDAVDALSAFLGLELRPASVEINANNQPSGRRATPRTSRKKRPDSRG